MLFPLTPRVLSHINNKTFITTIADTSSKTEAARCCIENRGLGICCKLICVLERHIEILIPATCECDLIENSIRRCNQVKIKSDWRSVRLKSNDVCSYKNAMWRHRGTETLGENAVGWERQGLEGCSRKDRQMAPKARSEAWNRLCPGVSRRNHPDQFLDLRPLARTVRE